MGRPLVGLFHEYLLRGGFLQTAPLESISQARKLLREDIVTKFEAGHDRAVWCPADPAIAPSVLLRGKALLEDPGALGRAVETSFFKHVYTRYYARSIGFSCWESTRDREVDIIAELEGRLVPFEVKYRAPEHTGLSDLKGMVSFCAERNVDTGYVITRDVTDFGVITVDHDDVNARP